METENHIDIFISHRNLDKTFVDALSVFLTTIGIPANSIFCSSLPGNDVKCEISKEIKHAIKTSKVNIVVLSDAYYKSPYCQQEAGAIWFCETKKIVLALPEIDADLMEGFLDNENMIRRLDCKNDILTIVDILKEASITINAQVTQIDYRADQLIVDYNRALSDRKTTIMSGTSNAENELEKEILSNSLSDDELLVLSYFYQSQRNKIEASKLDIVSWLNSASIKNVDIVNGITLLLEDNKINAINDEYGNLISYSLNIKFYRLLRRLSESAVQVLVTCMNNHASEDNKGSKNEIDNLIENGFSKEERLMIQYIIDLDRDSLFAGWQSEKEENMIRSWEDINGLNHVLSSKYNDILNKLLIRKFIEVKAITSFNNPKEYSLNAYFRQGIKTINSNSKRIIKETLDDCKDIFDSFFS
ncbi:MAG: toll/interleukin-1 receptor domain-containing protein [Clostridiaceae bacterium]|jgi:hypothetical protein|nr:toll/interleukin-1 receptor domain-containing protein [Clostridiaceae bacterium]